MANKPKKEAKNFGKQAPAASKPQAKTSRKAGKK